MPLRRDPHSHRRQFRSMGFGHREAEEQGPDDEELERAVADLKKLMEHSPKGRESIESR